MIADEPVSFHLLFFPPLSLFRCASISSTYPDQSVDWLVGNTFGFPFCQRLRALTQRQVNIAVADMVADMEVDMVADMEVDKVADMVGDAEVDMMADMVADMEVNMVADMELDKMANMLADMKVT